MLDKKVVSHIIGPAKHNLIFIFLAFVAIIAGIILISISDNNTEKADAKFFASDVAEKEYCYFDVQYITDWLIEDNDIKYYIVVDKDKNVGIVSMTSERHSPFTAEYTYHENQTAPAPEPIRIKGVVNRMSDQVENMLADYIDYDSVRDLEKDYGEYVMRVGIDPFGKFEGIGVVLIIIGFPLFLVLLCFYLNKCYLRRKTFRYYRDDPQFQNLQDELCNITDKELALNKAVFTDEFILFTNSGVAVRYSDVLWCYKRAQYTNGMETENCMMIATVPHRLAKVASVFNRLKYAGQIDRIMESICTHNPDAIAGFTPETKRLYRKRKKELKLK